jgi:hypothetical protein
MHTNRIYALICALIVTLVSSVALAQAAPDAASRIAAARRSVIALQETAEAGVITRSQADEGAKRYLAQASEAAGKPMTLDELVAAPDPGPTAGPAPQLTALQRFAGLVTFVNVLWVLGIVVGVISFAYLFGSFVKDLIRLLRDVPLVFYEVVFYAASLGLTIWGKTLSPGVAPFVGLTGCLLFGAAVLFTAKAHKSLKLGGALVSATMCLAWTIAALSYGSSMLGFIAVAALMSAFGFSILVMPLTYCIGFKDETSIGRATAAAFAILTTYVCVRVFGLDASILGVFESGALFLGSFVGYIGLLISSSRWYDGRGRNYVLFQLVTVAAGIAALFVGSVFGISELQKIGGTFFVLYLTEKLLEIPARNARGYAALGLVVSAAIFGFSMYVKSNPESLRPFLFMPK